MLAILGMHTLEETLKRTSERSGSEAVNTLEVGGPEDFACANIPVPGAHTGGFEDGL